MTDSIDNYESRVRAEIAHYKAEFEEESSDGLVKTPPVWNLVEAAMARKIEEATGMPDGVSYIVNELNKRDHPLLLSLGAGSCALETKWILPALGCPGECTLECIDINADIMEMGRAAAEQNHVRFIGTAMDINRLELPESHYDIIMAWASMHHFVELDHIAAQINRGLKPDGLFITMDICSRNGFRLWPETRVVIDKLWQKLFSPYRYAHTIGPEQVYCETFPDIDCSGNGFECIRSEDIVPALETRMERVHYIPAHALARRFFDTMFGPNFDLRREFDLKFIIEVLVRDEVAIQSGQLKPDTFFGVYRKRAEST